MKFSFRYGNFQVVQQLVDEYVAATTPDYLNWGIDKVHTSQQHQQTINIKAHGLNDAKINGVTELSVNGSEMIRHPISVEVSHQSLDMWIKTIAISITNEDGDGFSQDTTFVSKL